MQRLQNKGLITISYEEFIQMKNTTVLIRAHGEPPETYQTAKQNNITLIDATCPVVLRLQHQVNKAFKTSSSLKGQIVIYGKKGHAEVNGLVGQTNQEAIVINSIEELSKLDFTKPISIFSQTTQSPDAYKRVIEEIKNRMSKLGTMDLLTYNYSICRQVSSRDKELRLFADKHDIIIFVSGKQSSNGKALFEVCKSVNPKSYFVSERQEIDRNWFTQAQSIGICGATSTPMWLMKEIENYISSILD
jgi:4-hydroxy-3-methylbut-2-enyl diphosphate reductase